MTPKARRRAVRERNQVGRWRPSHRNGQFDAAGRVNWAAREDEAKRDERRVGRQADLVITGSAADEVLYGRDTATP